MDLLLLRGREGPARLAGDSLADDSSADSSSIAVRLRDGEDGALDVTLGGVLLRVNFQVWSQRMNKQALGLRVPALLDVETRP